MPYLSAPKNVSYLLAGVLVVATRMQRAHVPIDGHADQDDGALLGERAAEQGLENMHRTENGESVLAGQLSSDFYYLYYAFFVCGLRSVGFCSVVFWALPAAGSK